MKVQNIDQIFVDSLTEGNRDILRQVAKSDLHSHAGLAYKLEVLERWAQKEIPAPQEMSSISDMNDYIIDNLMEFYSKRQGFEFAIRAALVEAWNDGIAKLEMSIDIPFIQYYAGDPNRFAGFIAHAHQTSAKEIDFRPELGVARDLPLDTWLPIAEACIETGFFKSLDIYGTEDAADDKEFVPLFRKAKAKGMKLKAHLGEFCGPERVRSGIEELELDEVQHGIAAAEDKELMKWLADNKIQLNVCPTSNIKLKRVESYATHPIRKLFDHGVPVTINSDDILIFGQNVTDEYLNLYNAGVFSPEELNRIRKQGLAD